MLEARDQHLMLGILPFAHFADTPLQRCDDLCLARAGGADDQRYIRRFEGNLDGLLLSRCRGAVLEAFPGMAAQGSVRFSPERRQREVLQQKAQLRHPSTALDRRTCFQATLLHCPVASQGKRQVTLFGRSLARLDQYLSGLVPQ